MAKSKIRKSFIAIYLYMAENYFSVKQSLTKEYPITNNITKIRKIL